MNFKRKQEKPAGIGSICTLKNDVIEKIRQTNYYMGNSAPFVKCEGGTIYKSNLRKNLGHNNKIVLGDATLLYITSPSVFKGGLVNVIPLAVEKDGQQGFAVRTILEKAGSFLVNIKSLSLASSGLIESETSHYSYTAKNYISKLLRAEQI